MYASCLHDQIRSERPNTRNTNTRFSRSIRCPQCYETVSYYSGLLRFISCGQKRTPENHLRANCQLNCRRVARRLSGDTHCSGNPSLPLCQQIISQTKPMRSRRLTKEKNGANFGANSLSAIVDDFRGSNRGFWKDSTRRGRGNNTREKVYQADYNVRIEREKNRQRQE